MMNPRRPGNRIKAAAVIALFALATVSACADGDEGGGSGGADGTGGATDTSADRAFPAKAKPITIGVSQPFMTNAWQQALMVSAEHAVETLNQDGYDITLEMLDANSNPQTQVQQINDLVLKGVDVLLVNPSSSSALDGAVEAAIDAGIPTIVFADGPVTSTAPIELEYDVTGGQEEIARQTFDLIDGKGNVLNIRGGAGSGADPLWQAGVEAALEDYPDIEIVAEVFGEWDESTSQQRVAGIMSTLPEVDAILTQGQMGYGAAQAFLAAGREVPLQIFGTPGVELKFWQQIHAENGYTTKASSCDAGIGSIAINVAVALLNGEEIPKRMNAPFITIEQEDLDQFILDMEAAGVDSAFQDYDYQWTLDNILTQDIATP
ncbi:MAG: substrate-binding domain-containing protein [Bifidobacteriaceae bacterium]|jgi:ribose transport system substrate-binding protein|nr:substrate-binding domain-containing protein [Bifidobacteriaceae bacterium]